MTFTTPTKISELERELAALKMIYGDIDVTIWSVDWRGVAGWRPVLLRLGQNEAGTRFVKLEG